MKKTEAGDRHVVIFELLDSRQDHSTLHHTVYTAPTTAIYCTDSKGSKFNQLFFKNIFGYCAVYQNLLSCFAYNI